MRLRGWLVVGGILAVVACREPEAKLAPPQPPAAPAAEPADNAPNANAARYGPHGVSATPPPVESGKPARADDVPAAAGPADPQEAADDMRGHPCQCGKTCHCGHCAGAVPGCHCHVKRADGKEAE